MNANKMMSFEVGVYVLIFFFFFAERTSDILQIAAACEDRSFNIYVTPRRPIAEAHQKQQV